jgi:chromosome partitioning protein
MVAKIVTVAQQKGGAGKTTLAAHLAVAYTAMKKRVVAVDIDPQQSLSRWYELRREWMDGMPAGVLVSAIEGWRARAEVDRVAAGHDVVIIDSPPHAETEARIAIRAADLVVVPVQPSPMDVWATRPTLELAAAEKVPALLVFNRVLPRAKLTEAMEAEVKQLGAKIARARLGNRVAFAAALAEGKAVGESQPRGRAAQEIAALAKEILRAAR